METTYLPRIDQEGKAQIAGTWTTQCKERKQRFQLSYTAGVWCKQLNSEDSFLALTASESLHVGKTVLERSALISRTGQCLTPSQPSSSLWADGTGPPSKEGRAVLHGGSLHRGLTATCTQGMAMPKHTVRQTRLCNLCNVPS